MKLALSIAALLISCAPPKASAADLQEKWLGTYSSQQTNFVTMKRIELGKQKDGSVKIKGWLVGFPDEVFLGESTPEAYADRNNKNKPDRVTASFPSGKYQAMVVITPAYDNGKSIRDINLECYMKDVDGANIHFGTTLTRND